MHELAEGERYVDPPARPVGPLVVVMPPAAEVAYVAEPLERLPSGRSEREVRVCVPVGEGRYVERRVPARHLRAL